MSLVDWNVLEIKYVISMRFAIWSKLKLSIVEVWWIQITGSDVTTKVYNILFNGKRFATLLVVIVAFVSEHSFYKFLEHVNWLYCHRAADSGGKGAKKGRTDKDAGDKGKIAKTLSDGPSSALPPTLSPVYSSAVVPPAPRKSETKRAISNIISSLSPKRFARLWAHSVFGYALK